MYSRAHLLIEKEYEKFKKESPWVCILAIYNDFSFTVFTIFLRL